MSNDSFVWNARLLERSKRNENSAGYLSAYELWKGVWQATYQELDKQSTLASNDFERQDAWTALFVGEQCVGLCGYRKVDLSDPWTRHDSWFAAWPDSAFKKAQQMTEASSKGTEAWIGSNFTVHPDFRHQKTADGLSAKKILTALTIPFLASAGDLPGIGMTRKDKNMHMATYEWGALCIEENGQAHGVPVDYVIYTKESANAALKNPLWFTVSRLWSQGVGHSRVTTANQTSKRKKVA